MLVLLNAREEALAADPGARARVAALGAEELDIGPLPDEPHRELVAKLLGLEDELARQVVERTGGHPLFAVQLVGDWVGRGVLESGREGFRLAPGERALLPDDIHESWRARVRDAFGELSDEEREGTMDALEVAAALGVEIDTGEWTRACEHAGVGRAPRARVEPLLARRLALGDPDQWSFVHGMLRESLERRARDRDTWEERQRACAAMLAEGRGRGLAERRARHLLAAGDLAEAIGPLYEAASERGKTADFERAEALFAERGAVLDRLGASTHDPRRVMGDVERARLFAKQGRVDRALALMARVRDPGTSAGGWLRAETNRVEAFVAHKAGDLAGAVTLFEAALAEFEALGDDTSAAKCLHGLAEAHRARGELELATARYGDAIALHERLSNERERANGFAGLAITLRRRGELVEARTLVGEALEIFERIGDPLGAAVCRNELGEIARFRGELAVAEAHYREAAAAARALGAKDALIGDLNVALLQLAQDHFERAAQAFEAVREAFVEAQLVGFLAYPFAGLLACAAAEGDWARWDACFERVSELLESTGVADEDLAWPLERAATLARERGEDARGDAAARLARDQRARPGRR